MAAYPAAVPVTEEQAAIFDAAVAGYPMIQAAIYDAAVAGYPMIQAAAVEVTERQHFLGRKEYLFTANDTRNGAAIKVNVLVEEGKEPVFTQVYR